MPRSQRNRASSEPVDGLQRKKPKNSLLESAVIDFERIWQASQESLQDKRHEAQVHLQDGMSKKRKVRRIPRSANAGALSGDEQSERLRPKKRKRLDLDGSNLDSTFAQNKIGPAPAEKHKPSTQRDVHLSRNEPRLDLERNANGASEEPMPDARHIGPTDTRRAAVLQVNGREKPAKPTSNDAHIIDSEPEAPFDDTPSLQAPPDPCTSKSAHETTRAVPEGTEDGQFSTQVCDSQPMPGLLPRAPSAQSHSIATVDVSHDLFSTPIPPVNLDAYFGTSQKREVYRRMQGRQDRIVQMLLEWYELREALHHPNPRGEILSESSPSHAFPRQARQSCTNQSIDPMDDQSERPEHVAVTYHPEQHPRSGLSQPVAVDKATQHQPIGLMRDHGAKNVLSMPSTSIGLQHFGKIANKNFNAEATLPDRLPTDSAFGKDQQHDGATLANDHFPPILPGNDTQFMMSTSFMSSDSAAIAPIVDKDNGPVRPPLEGADAHLTSSDNESDSSADRLSNSLPSDFSKLPVLPQKHDKISSRLSSIHSGKDKELDYRDILRGGRPRLTLDDLPQSSDDSVNPDSDSDDAPSLHLSMASPPPRHKTGRPATAIEYNTVQSSEDEEAVPDPITLLSQLQSRSAPSASAGAADALPPTELSDLAPKPLQPLALAPMAAHEESRALSTSDTNGSIPNGTTDGFLDTQNSTAALQTKNNSASSSQHSSLIKASDSSDSEKAVESQLGAASPVHGAASADRSHKPLFLPESESQLDSPSHVVEPCEIISGSMSDMTQKGSRHSDLKAVNGEHDTSDSSSSAGADEENEYPAAISQNGFAPPRSSLRSSAPSASSQNLPLSLGTLKQRSLNSFPSLRAQAQPSRGAPQTAQRQSAHNNHDLDDAASASLVQIQQERDPSTATSPRLRARQEESTSQARLSYNSRAVRRQTLRSRRRET